MPVYRMDIAFNGTKYFGWQRQTNGCVTVQQVIEDFLRRFFHDPGLNLCSSSRTDTGVHALNLTTSFHSDNDIRPEEVAESAEKQLPHDIRINAVQYAVPDFNAQRCACGKAYVYAVLPCCYTLFMRDLCWSWPNAQNPELLRDLLPAFIGTHDFTSFTGRDMKNENPVRTLYRAEMYSFGPVTCFYFSGNGFLNRMVRRIVGTLYETASGRLSPDDVKQMLENPFRTGNDFQAPPDGLYLKKVFYTAEEWKQDTLTHLPFLS